MTVTTADVTAAIIGVKVPQENTGVSFLNPGGVNAQVESQPDGSYIVTGLVNNPIPNNIVFAAVPGQPTWVSFQYDKGFNFYAQVVAFDSTHVLLTGISDIGGKFVPNTNVYVLSDGGVPPPSAYPFTVFPTGSSYTNPNGVTITGAPCFGRGTFIATPDGEVAIELLRKGDLVLTVSGQAQPLVWTGARSINIARHPRPETVRPVCIRCGAFSTNVPARDLLVSPDHNVFVEGVLIPAKCLVNGRNVVLHDVETIDYHHIELASHDVVYANGLQTETYLDTGNRNSFKGEGVVAAHPDFSSAPDHNYFAWESKGYARLVLVGPELDRARARLAECTEAASVRKARVRRTA